MMILSNDSNVFIKGFAIALPDSGLFGCFQKRCSQKFGVVD